MKRILSLVLACILLLTTLAACGPKKEGPSGSSQPDDGEKKKVYIFVKNRGDLSMWDSIAAGGDKAAVDFADRAEVKVIETTADVQACLTAMYEAAEDGADLIYAGNDFADCILEVGEAFPEIAMFSAGNINDMTEKLDRMYAFQVLNDACFLAGILSADLATSGAAGTDKSGVIGFIGGKDETINIQNHFIGYIYGAKHYKPEIKIVYNYVNDWNDPDKARTQALAQYNDSKAEVIYASAGASGNGAYQAASEVGKYAVGADFDQAKKYKEAGKPDIASQFVTSTVVHYDVIIYNTIKKFLDDGKLDYGRFEFLGMKDGAVSCAEGEVFDSLISEEGKKAYFDAKDKILKGELKIPISLDKEQPEIKALIEDGLNINK